MEKTNKRGKIPQSDWPLIMARYEGGETLSSIARTYDCSPPAISYIVSRNRDKITADAAAAPLTEPQLVKVQTNGAAADGTPLVKPPVAPPAPAPAPPPAAEIRRESNGDARAAAPANGEPRAKLHLSLGNGNGNGNGNGHYANGHGNGHGNGHAAEPARPSFVVPQPQGERAGQRPFQAPARAQPAFDAGRNGRDLFAAMEGRPLAQQPRDADAIRKENSAFIDQELRTRVNGDIAAFLEAFDAALAADTQESRFSLREATDRLLRAGARTRIELERLEARVPLPPRDLGAADPAASRYR